MPYASNCSLLAQIENFDLRFYNKYYRPTTLRTLFVGGLGGGFPKDRPQGGSFEVLKNINLKIYRGDRIGILGRNGAGKSTLCRSVSGFYKPVNGSVSVNGSIRAVYNSGAGIHPELTGRENAYLLAELIYPGRENIKDIVEESLEFSELGSKLDLPFKYYSSGMQTRLHLSIATGDRDDLLILDEVFGGADLKFRRKIVKRIMGLVSRCEALLFVSHSLDQIKTVCNRAIVLDRGKIIFDGSPKMAEKVYLWNGNTSD